MRGGSWSSETQWCSSWSTGWTDEGDGLYSRDWSYDWGQADEVWASYNFFLGQLLARREVIIINGEVMQQKIIEKQSWDNDAETWVYDGLYSDVGTLDPGFFAVSEIEDDKIWLRLPQGLAMADATIELPIRGKAMEIRGKNNLVVRNLDFYGFNDTFGSGWATQVITMHNSLVEDCSFNYNNINGFGFNGATDSVARRLTITTMAGKAWVPV